MLPAIVSVLFFISCSEDRSEQDGDTDTGTDAGADTGADTEVIDERCPAGLAWCSGTCVNISTDHGNCGVCGVECDAIEVCYEGDCLLECPVGRENCGGSCVDVDSDPFNCGDCGEACLAGVNALPVCIGGECDIVCLAGWSDLDHDGSCETPCIPTGDEELCNGIDDNCDGNIDEGFEKFQCPITGDVFSTQTNCNANCNVTEACDSNTIGISGMAGALRTSGCCSFDYRALQMSGSGGSLNVNIQHECKDYGYYGGCDAGELVPYSGDMTFSGTTVAGSAGLLTDPECSSVRISRVVLAGSGDELEVTTGYKCGNSDKSRTDRITFDGARVSGTAGAVVDDGCCSVVFWGLQLSGSGGSLQVATEYNCTRLNEYYGTCINAEIKRKVETLTFEGADYSCPLGDYSCFGDPPECIMSEPCIPVISCY
ncbi:MAG: hypothetical protein ABIJ56_05870 [Pseudomonadota bacterium]